LEFPSRPGRRFYGLGVRETPFWGDDVEWLGAWLDMDVLGSAVRESALPLCWVEGGIWRIVWKSQRNRKGVRLEKLGGKLGVQ
jgi:hypothetical protein